LLFVHFHLFNCGQTCRVEHCGHPDTAASF
jgi:hypothetical protein